MKMYVIKYDRDIYAGTYSDMDGCYLYPSCDINMQKPKIFKTLKGAEKHLSNLKNKVVYGKMLIYIILRLLNGLKMI